MQLLAKALQTLHLKQGKEKSYLWCWTLDQMHNEARLFNTNRLQGLRVP